MHLSRAPGARRRMATIVGSMDNSRLRWTLWVVYVTAWTILLVTTKPAHVMREVVPEPARFPVAKTGHVAGYAVLTMLSAWLHVRGNRRWLLLAFVSLH